MLKADGEGMQVATGQGGPSSGSSSHLLPLSREKGFWAGGLRFGFEVGFDGFQDVGQVVYDVFVLETDDF